MTEETHKLNNCLPFFFFIEKNNENVKIITLLIWSVVKIAHPLINLYQRL
jgi:hypothetical protein